MIEIFKEIQTKKENAILLLVGTGELKEEIQNQVKELGLEEQVRFLGVRSDVDQIMKCFDVFLFPSLFEGLPVTMVEAQAAGDLCIISDTNSKRMLYYRKCKDIFIGKRCKGME